MELRNRRRLQLLLIVAIFAGSVILAAGMMLSGWAPSAHSYGQPIEPERPLARMPVKTADGTAFAFTNRTGAWTLLALPGPDCAQRCLRQLDLVHRAQIALGKQADKVRLVYLGPVPAGPAAAGFGKVWVVAGTAAAPLRGLRATAPDSVSMVLVTPSGRALLAYPAGFDPARLHQDLQRAVKVNL
ncbi:MAG: hypothetical protein EPN38_09775 [Rhodanobacteraceae bacterium]|nr:MAG: hypothetical protein EPN38_09775 [Rhodanobacteraceae bacterium]